MCFLSIKYMVKWRTPKLHRVVKETLQLKCHKFKFDLWQSRAFSAYKKFMLFHFIGVLTFGLYAIREMHTRTYRSVHYGVYGHLIWTNIEEIVYTMATHKRYDASNVYFLHYTPLSERKINLLFYNTLCILNGKYAPPSNFYLYINAGFVFNDVHMHISNKNTANINKYKLQENFTNTFYSF